MLNYILQNVTLYMDDTQHNLENPSVPAPLTLNQRSPPPSPSQALTGSVHMKVFSRYIVTGCFLYVRRAVWDTVRFSPPPPPPPAARPVTVNMEVPPGPAGRKASAAPRGLRPGQSASQACPQYIYSQFRRPPLSRAGGGGGGGGRVLELWFDGGLRPTPWNPYIPISRVLLSHKQLPMYRVLLHVNNHTNL